MAIGANLIIGNPTVYRGSSEVEPGRLMGTVGAGINITGHIPAFEPENLVGSLSARVEVNGRLPSIQRLMGTVGVVVEPNAFLAIEHHLAGGVPVEVPLRGHIFPPILLSGSVSSGIEYSGDLTAPVALKGTVGVEALLRGNASIIHTVELKGRLGAGVRYYGDLTATVALGGSLELGVGFSGDLDTTPALDPDAQAIIDAMDVEPNASRKQLILDTVLSLKNAALWGKLGLLYITAAHTDQAARIDWITPVATNRRLRGTSVGFTQDEGFSNDGGGLNAGIHDFGGGTLDISVNDTHVGLWLDAAQDATNTLVVADNPDYVIVTPKAGNGNFAGVLNGGGIGIIQSDLTETPNYVVGSRSSENTVDWYREGQFATAQSQNSTNLPNGLIQLIDGSTGEILKVFHVGPSLTANEVADLYNILQNYLDNL